MLSYRIIIIIILNCLIADSYLPTRYSLGSSQLWYEAHGWPSKGILDLRHGSDGSLFAGTGNGLGKIGALPINFSITEIEDNLYKIIDSNLPQGGNPAVKTYPLDNEEMLIFVSGSIDIPDPLGYCGASDICQVGTGISWSVDSG